MAYQRIFSPGPRSNRFPFAGADAPCCEPCALNLPCGTPLGQAKGGAPSLPGSVAGADPALRQLADDVKVLAQQANAAWGNVTLNQTLYDRLKRQATQPATGTFRLTPAEAKQFVTGTVVDVTAAYVKGMQLANVAAPTAARRNQLLATQRQLAQTARRMLNQATQALEGSRPERPVSGVGVGGLGFACGGACIAAIAVVAAGVAILIAGAAVYSWAQSASELRSAMTMAERICNETPGGCTSAERAALIRELRMPDPISRGVENVTRGLGEGLRTTVMVVGIGGAVVLAGYAWLRLTPTGRRLYNRWTGRAA